MLLIQSCSFVIFLLLLIFLAYAIFVTFHFLRTKKLRKTNDAISNTYISICYADLISDTFEEIYSAEYVRNVIGKKGKPQEALDKSVFNGFVMETYIDRMKEFTDLSTLENRLKGKKIISQEYEGPKLGWCRANFIPVEYDKNGKLKGVLYAVQNIHGEILSLRDKLNVEETLLECVLALSKSTDADKSINRLLMNVAYYHHADRAYLFEFNNENQTASNTYEWCARDKKPQIQNLQNIKLDNLFLFIDVLKTGVLNIPNIDFFAEDSFEYKLLRQLNVRSIMAAPIYKNGEMIGFLGIDNPHFNQETETILISVSSFVVTELEKKNYINELYDLSYKDMLTGIFNRHANMRDTKELANNKVENIGIVYGDVNGLKEANDKFDHEHGDRLIIDAVNMLKKYYSRDDDKIYRMGGDEFVVICRNVQEYFFNKNYNDMVKELGTDYILSTGKSWLASCSNIDEHIKVAEHGMYESKKYYYQTHDRRAGRGA